MVLSQWVRSVDRTNAVFHNHGTLRMQSGHYKLIKRIDLNRIRIKVDLAEEHVNKLKEICHQKETSCSRLIEERTSSLLSTGIIKLRHDLFALFTLTGKRQKKSINAIGSAFNYLFGLMDHDDEQYLKLVLQNITNVEADTHFVLDQHIHILKDINNQSQILRKNQETMFGNLETVKSKLQEQVKYSMQIEWQMTFQNLELQLNYLFLSIQAEIDKIHTALLFLKAGILDPFIIDSEELKRSLNSRILNFRIDNDDIDSLLNFSNLIVAADRKANIIYTILLIPTASTRTFTLYQVLPLPKLVDGNIITLDGVEHYFAVSLDESRFIFRKDLQDCITISDGHICRNSLQFLPARNSCISEIFFHSLDSSCDYRRLHDSFDAFNLINNGVLIFSTKGLQVNLSCETSTDSQTLQGSFLINLPENCSVTSKLFSFDNSDFHDELLLRDEIPEISCCSGLFSPPNQTDKAHSISLKSLSDIKTLDSESFTNNWKSYIQIDFKNSFENWHFMLMACVVIIVICIWIMLKCKRKNSARGTVASTTIVNCPTPNVTRNDVTSQPIQQERKFRFKYSN